MGLYAREETTMKTVLVLFGGKSSEYEVSLLSASSVVRNIPREKYNIVTLGITKDGKWRLFEGDTDKIESDDWIPSSLKAYINIDYGSKQVIVEDGRIIDIDVCFPVLHGRNGEDGTVAALLTLAGIPFVGCDNLAGAVCMDKAVTNALADYENVPQAKWLKIDKFEYADNGSAFLNDCFEKLGCPVFVKPANTGSSVGVEKASDKKELENAIKEAFKYDKKIVVEECIAGREVECAVLGSINPTVSVVGEIKPANEFYDYDAKYKNDSSVLLIPAPLDEKTSGEIRSLAVKIFKSLNCTGLSRVDFFVQSDGKVKFNEINTLPGFTPISMYPKLFDECGIKYPDLIDRLLNSAIEREA